MLLAYHAGALPALLAERGVAVALWNRRAAGSATAQPWPPAGPFDVALLRLPKAKDEQEMAAHACLSVLADGGRLIVYGGNDEGIRSAGAMLERLCGEVETLATRGHGRVLAARRPADAAHAARRAGGVALGGAAVDRRRACAIWVTYPGIFAAGRIDEGTALLIGALPPLRAGDRVLDYGCGSGVIGAAALAAEPGIVLDLLDDDAVALEAARENVPGARLVLGNSARRRRQAPTTPSCRTRRCTRALPRTMRCSSSSSPMRRATCGRAAVCSSSCSAACRSSGGSPSISHA